MQILKYKPEHEESLLSAIKQDADWEVFTNDAAIGKYKQRLRSDVTYVCCDGGTFCGYVRAILDDGFAVYISELYVVPRFRNRMIGRSLVARVKTDHGGLAVYALSDEDAYYEKLGYKRIGSVFVITS
jgi:ribosomal protein S18 acetylase RimI-like enzyme